MYEPPGKQSATSVAVKHRVLTVFKGNLKAFHDQRSSFFPPVCRRNSAASLSMRPCRGPAGEKGGRGWRKRSTKKGRGGFCLDLVPRRKEGLESSLRHSPPPPFPPPRAHTHTHVLGTGAGLCGRLVGLAYRFTSVHHRRLTCAFTGRRRRLGHRLSNVVQRWLSVHGNWRGGRRGEKAERQSTELLARTSRLHF